MIPALLALLDALPDDSPFRQLDPAQRRQRTLTALKRVLLRESQVQPLLLVCEDLHWIDTETQALLDSLVESLPTAQILLLVNYRPEYQHGWGSKTYYTQLRLDPLPPLSADEFLHALLGDDASRRRSYPAHCAYGGQSLLPGGERAHAGGDRYCKASGLPSGTSPADLQVPATVQGGAGARIDRLPPEEKGLLQTAAVIGNEVPLPLCRPLPICQRRCSTAASHTYRPPSFSMRHGCSPSANIHKHALTHEVAYGGSCKSGGARYTPGSSRPLRRSPGTGEPSRSNAWRTTPCGGGVGQGPGILPTGRGEGHDAVGPP